MQVDGTLSCGSCGYDLRGQVAHDVCPECGTAVAQSREALRVRERRVRRGARLLVAAITFDSAMFVVGLIWGRVDALWDAVERTIHFWLEPWPADLIVMIFLAVEEGDKWTASEALWTVVLRGLPVVVTYVGLVLVTSRPLGKHPGIWRLVAMGLRTLPVVTIAGWWSTMRVMQWIQVSDVSRALAVAYVLPNAGGLLVAALWAGWCAYLLRERGAGWWDGIVVMGLYVASYALEVANQVLGLSVGGGWTVVRLFAWAGLVVGTARVAWGKGGVSTAEASFAEVAEGDGVP